ncbi:hypothetical protein [Catenuloplanes indicus]|uniref:Aminoglycoside phosphotransferase (APT) family kinase protein n=1 Tax=Catenuloplanes indicus TaxID=137267 RepID=A0AAE3WAB4_9ACTN|nr:hypothetical protein [Catenuloplanes indicus]MDQ0371320.1 aminoglycoside phosphotransferase (APT) family kinase protein [Catenuloplanes indicus]
MRRLIQAQFPQWPTLAVTPVRVDGCDDRTYRLGTTMSVRMPPANDDNDEVRGPGDPASDR